MTCSSCKNTIHDRAVLCVNCGASIDNPMPKRNYQPMAGFFLSLFFPLIGLIVSIVQFAKCFKRRGLFIFPLLGLLISLANIIARVVLAFAYYSLIMEIINMV